MWKRMILVPVLAIGCGGGGGGHDTIDAPMHLAHTDAPDLPHDAQIFLDAPERGQCGNPGSGVGCTEVDWRFVMIAGNGAPTDTTACSAQFDTAVLVARPTDASGTPTGTCDGVNPSGTCVVDLYDCTALTGTQTLPVGMWLDDVAITDTNGTVTYATSPAHWLGTLGETNTAVTHVTFVTNGGYFRAAWTTTGCSVGRNVLLSTPISVDEYACEDGDGAYNYGAPLPAGSIDVTAQLFDTSGDLGDPDRKTLAIGSQSAIVDTGTFTVGP